VSEQPTIAAQLAQIREQVRQVLPAVQADAALRRALIHTQRAVERRLGLPNETPIGRSRRNGGNVVE
jgi:hypothetical protein